MESQPYNVIHLPDEIIVKILSFIHPEKISIIFRVNKLFYRIARSNYFWKKKCIDHFPYIYNSKSHNEDWIQEFLSIYKKEYAGLDDRKKEMISLIKENKIDELNLDLTDLEVFSKKLFFINYFSCNNIFEKQNILNQLFKFIENNCSISSNSNHDKSTRISLYFRSIFWWLIFCNQTIEKIEWFLNMNDKINLTQPSASMLNDLTYEIFEYFNEKWSLLRLSARLGHIHLVQYLTNKITNINDEDQKLFFSYALKEACTSEHFNIIEWMIKKHSDVLNYGILSFAVKKNNLPVAKYLIEKCGDNLNQDNHFGSLPLWTAADLGHLEMVQLLIEHGAFVDQTDLTDQTTPLTIASYCGHLDIVKYLIEHGANINHVNVKDANEAGTYETTPFIEAFWGDSYAVMEYLIEQDSEINRLPVHEIWMLIFNAAISNHFHLIENLIKKGKISDQFEAIKNSCVITIGTGLEERWSLPNVVRKMIEDAGLGQFPSPFFNLSMFSNPKPANRISEAADALLSVLKGQKSADSLNDYSIELNSDKFGKIYRAVLPFILCTESVRNSANYRACE